MTTILTASQLASAFVSHTTLLLAVNLTHDLDPVLAGFLPDEVPTADELLDDQVLIGQVIRAPRGDVRLERTLAWLEQVWFNLGDRASIAALVRQELEARRHVPVIFDLDDGLIRAANLLDLLVRQCAGLMDTAPLAAILSLLRQWQVDRRRETLLDLERHCLPLLRNDDATPAAEQVRRIRFLAVEGALPADEYLSLHFDPQALPDWDMAELTRLIRTRYPLLRRDDVEAMVAARSSPVRAAVA
ncbi:hypothetical protein CHU95_14235 [Niveispirillum lacus]|uniref:Uncharacterized protein n=1 Tax=Niveispirillum lacus TaxID=1981099 RepID=A0A255YWF8_9PROT|nr:hypothetical protein [Niveispirillum lacus]OYQ33542.1 hypothetical protein CHU95_14235 [Niveispirillum lacus]